jgi:hypothetical protein
MGLISLIYRLKFETPPIESQVPIFISPQEQGSPIILLDIGFLKVQVLLRPMANAPAFRGVRHTFGAHYQIFITVAILLM